LRKPENAIIKIKSKRIKQLFEALKMQSCDVLLGARKRRHRDEQLNAARAAARILNAAEMLGSAQASHSRMPQKSRTTGRERRPRATREQKQWG
jgi:hypothetical protein